MVGVAQQDLSAHFEEFSVIESLDAGLGANWHKNWGFNDAVRRVQASQSGAGSGVLSKEFEHGRSLHGK